MASLRRVGNLACVLILTLLAAGASCAAVVTLDWATRKATSDSADVEVKSVRKRGEEIVVQLRNATKTKQPVAVKVVGLTEGNYGVRINDSDWILKTSEQLTQGLELELYYYEPDPVLMRCLEAVQPRAGSEYRRLRQLSSKEAERAAHTVSQAEDWANASIRAVETHKCATVVIGPTGLPPANALWRTWYNAEETAQIIDRSCKLLQIARNRMFTVLTDPEIRNAAVAAMTPVDFEASYEVKNGKAHVEATLVNNCNIPVSGNFSYGLPNGWKTTAKDLTFKNIASGGVHKLSFDLIAPDKTSAPPESLPIAANVTISEVIDPVSLGTDPTSAILSEENRPREYLAITKLKVILKKNGGVVKHWTAPPPPKPRPAILQF